MLTREELITECDSFPERYDTTIDMKGHECLFGDIMHIAVEYIDYHDIAQHFEAIPSTVLRYGKGVVRPHPLMQKQIVKYVADKLREQLEVK